jgi:hypothetical protein
VERALIQKLGGMLDEFQTQGAWGTVGIEIRDGLPNFVRKSIAEKVAQENTRGGQ